MLHADHHASGNAQQQRGDPARRRVADLSTIQRRTAKWTSAELVMDTELHCASNRNRGEVDVTSVGIVLDAIALRVGADELVTYNAELATAAIAAGIVVGQPS